AGAPSERPEQHRPGMAWGEIMEDRSTDLLARWRGGDEQAAGALFRRYAERLLALARARLSSRLAPHFGPEGVGQSAYPRGFCGGARAGRYALRRSGDLWRLLVAITLHKLQHRVERHAAGKRSVTREANFGGESSLFGLGVPAFARDPSPSEAAALADTLEQ